MSSFKARATTLGGLLAVDIVYEIPDFQRAYAWTMTEAGQLLDDILLAWSDTSGEADDYFLGTMLMVERVGSRRDRDTRVELSIIDGQQRLVTLTILLSVIRDLADDRGLSLGSRLHPLVMHSGGSKVDERPRLQLNRPMADFFQRLVQRRGALAEMPGDDAVPQEAQSLLDVREHFAAILVERADEELVGLAGYLIDNCVVAVIVTSTLERAHRMFTVINNRGRPLGRHDILKAEILGGIDATVRTDYAARWRRLEDKLDGRFEDLFSHIRAAEEGGRSRILTSIEGLMLAKGGAQAFFDDCLEPYGEMLHAIVDPSAAAQRTGEVGKILGYLGWLGGSEWIPPLLLYWRRNGGGREALLPFLRMVDRQAYGFRLLGYGADKRHQRFGRLLAAVRAGESPDLLSVGFVLTKEEERLIWQNLRNLHERSQLTCKLLLLRLNDQLAGNLQRLEPNDYTVEHVLPRKPGRDSTWREWFTSADEREACTQSLGNLILVSRSSNEKARNLDLKRKLNVYFGDAESVPFLTRDLAGRERWAAPEIRQREARLLAAIAELWTLSAGKWSSVRASGDAAVDADRSVQLRRKGILRRG